MFVFFIHLWNFGKISILLASSGSFHVKNDNIYTFFALVWLLILNLPTSLQKKNTRVGPFSWKRYVLQNPDRERTNKSTGICLRLGLPYNNKREFGIAVTAVEPAGQVCFVYMKTRLMSQCNGKWPISLVYAWKPLITATTAIGNWCFDRHPIR